MASITSNPDSSLFSYDREPPSPPTLRGQPAPESAGDLQEINLAAPESPVVTSQISELASGG